MKCKRSQEVAVEREMFTLVLFCIKSRDFESFKVIFRGVRVLKNMHKESEGGVKVIRHIYLKTSSLLLIMQSK